MASPTSHRVEFVSANHNIFCRPYVAGHDGQVERAGRVAAAYAADPHMAGVDAVSFCEAFVDFACDRMLDDLASIGMCYATPVVGDTAMTEAEARHRARVALADAPAEADVHHCLVSDSRGGYVLQSAPVVRHAAVAKGSGILAVHRESFALPEVSFTNGGVRIVSKWPIERYAQHIFEHHSGSDALARKGVMYARVLKKCDKCHLSHPFNVFATHLQAWSTPKARAVRMQQAAEIVAFVDAQGIPADEPVVFQGDLNVDSVSFGDEVRQLLSILAAKEPQRAGDQLYTSDPSVDVLVGRDGAASDNECADAYERSWGSDNKVSDWRVYNRKDQDVKFKDPVNRTACAHTPKGWTGGGGGKSCYCPCCPFEYLDYVLWSTRHKQAVPEASRVVVSMAVAPESQPVPVWPWSGALQPWARPGAVGTFLGADDISDHQPVVATLAFDFPASSGVASTSAVMRHKWCNLRSPRNADMLGCPAECGVIGAGAPRTGEDKDVWCGEGCQWVGDYPACGFDHVSRDYGIAYSAYGDGGTCYNNWKLLLPRADVVGCPKGCPSEPGAVPGDNGYCTALRADGKRCAWSGTAGFCGGDPYDCGKGSFAALPQARAVSERGDGKPCLTGRKVLCSPSHTDER